MREQFIEAIAECIRLADERYHRELLESGSMSKEELRQRINKEYASSILNTEIDGYRLIIS